MAKNTQKTDKTQKLTMVPVTAGSISSLSVATPVSLETLPKGFKKLTLPPLLKPEQIPVGSMVSGEIIKLIDSISDKAPEGKLVHIRHESGSEFILPLTGTIKKALGGFEGVKEQVGKKIVIVRMPDGETRKYTGPNDPPKKVFMFDVYLSE